MNRRLAILAVAATTTLNTNLFAVDGVYRGNPHGDPHRRYGHWDHHPVHTPNLTQLDALSDRLAKIAEHLHQDAHQLSLWLLAPKQNCDK